MITIYVLREGCDGPIRYVGQTGKALAVRLAGHRGSARYGLTAVARWLAARSDVRIEAVRVVPRHDALSAETELIVILREQGADLLNERTLKFDVLAHASESDRTNLIAISDRIGDIDTELRSLSTERRLIVERNRQREKRGAP